MTEMDQDYRCRPKITLFLPDLGIGGAERVFITLSKHFVRKKFQVDLVLANKSGPLLNEVDSGVNIIDLAAYRPGEPTWLSAVKTLVSLTQYLRATSPDVLVATLTGANLAVLVARIFSRKKFRLIIREAATLANVKSGIRLKFMRLLYLKADKIIVLTEFMKHELVASLKLPDENVTVIGNPIDSERIRLQASDPVISQYAREKTPYAIVIGRLEEQKDIFTAIRAVADVNNKKLLNLVVIGEGQQRGDLLKLAQTLSISNRIFDLGYQSNPYPWIRQAEVYILSSKWEGYPNVLLEAMALGCPIVATEYDASVRDILSAYPEQLYRIVSIGNRKEMANAILELVDQIGIAKTEGMNNINHIVDQYLLAFNINTSKQN